MSEQNGTPTLDELLRGGSFDLGDNTSDYDPFAQANEMSDEEEPNITHFSTDEGEEADNDEQDADEGSDDEESENLNRLYLTGQILVEQIKWKKRE